MTTASQTALPGGVIDRRLVIARYLTVAGEALADPRLAVEITVYDGFALDCTACPFTDWAIIDYSIGVDFRAEHAERRAREQAQEHAEKCRAITPSAGGWPQDDACDRPDCTEE